MDVESSDRLNQAYVSYATFEEKCAKAVFYTSLVILVAVTAIWTVGGE